MQHGLYLQALADSLDVVLEPYRKKLLELEQRYLEKPNYTLMYFYTQIKQYETFLQFVNHFINELKAQKFHGCAILRHLHKYNFSGDPKIMTAIRIIRKAVYAVFLRQLSQWLIYGRMIDPHDEFFIVHSEAQKNASCLIGTMTNHSASAYTAISGGTISDSTSGNTNLWHYEILYDMLPPNFSPSWAEKVLFIGQTVVMLNADPRKLTKKVSIWNDDEYEMEIGSLWNNQEHIYFNKIQALYNAEAIDSGAYEHVINEIKAYVTERLSEIAFNQADLIKHLKLVKDYYLLGRGELFLEFIKQIETITVTDGNVNEQVARDVNKAFQTALYRTNIDLDQLTMHLPLDDNDMSSLQHNDDDPQLFLQLVNLKFKVKWPLHLFFSPLILKRYNELFRFLLQIRKLQNDLHSIWWIHHEKQMARNSAMSQLRTQLMFLIDNLQYYLQVDVLESQFSILINTVQNSKDFEFIQRAHNVFQANIMSLCFLLNSGVNDAGSMLNSTSINAKNGDDLNENPVLTILRKIMRIVRTFYQLNSTCSDPMSNEDKQQLELNDRL